MSCLLIRYRPYVISTKNCLANHFDLCLNLGKQKNKQNIIELVSGCLLLQYLLESKTLFFPLSGLGFSPFRMWWILDSSTRLVGNRQLQCDPNSDSDSGLDPQPQPHPQHMPYLPLPPPPGYVCPGASPLLSAPCLSPPTSHLCLPTTAAPWPGQGWSQYVLSTSGWDRGQL